MDFFKQNSEFTLEEEELVKENVFLRKEPDTDPLPVFGKIKDLLPLPVWDGHQDTIDCYWKTWELAFGNLCKPQEGTGFVSNFIDTAFNGCIFMWDSSFILMFGKYADRTFNFQGTLDNLYSHQHKDGFICREIEESTGRDHFTRYDPSATGPAVMAWCEWEYFQNFGDKDSHLGLRDGNMPLKEALEALEKHAPNAVWALENGLDYMEDSVAYLVELGYIKEK